MSHSINYSVYRREVINSPILIVTTLVCGSWLFDHRKYIFLFCQLAMSPAVKPVLRMVSAALVLEVCIPTRLGTLARVGANYVFKIYFVCAPTVNIRLEMYIEVFVCYCSLKVIL